jgi:tetratricopeptide (TPR) repeat protein
MRSILLGTIVLAAVVSAAKADAVSDATAGLEALNRGDAKAAREFFTHAIDSGKLSPNDLEYAYVERGKAYLQRNEPDHARRDADKALSLNPTDPDAKTLWLQTTIEAQPATGETAQDPTTMSFQCIAANSQNAHPIGFEVNQNKGWVRSTGFEKGRKIEFQPKGDLILWHFHEERANSSEYLDQDLSLDESRKILVNNFRTSTGKHGVMTYICQ